MPVMGRTPAGGSRPRPRGAGLVLAVALAMAALTGCAGGEPAPPAAEPTSSGTATPSDDVEPSATPTTPAPTSTTPAPTPSVPSTPAPPAAAPTLGFDRLGPARLGMTMDEFGAALGMPVTLVESSGYADPCWFEWLGGVDSGIAVMSVEGREGPVVRIDVSGSAARDVAALPRTERGVGVGSSADDVRAVYAGQVQEAPHAYGGGQYLTVTDPAAPAGTALVFETDEAGTVTSMRAGLAEPVSFIEGCS